MHLKALSALGVRQTRGGLEEITAALEAGPVPFSEWWSSVGRLKSKDQLNTKLGALGFTEGGEDINSIGKLLFGHLLSCGNYSAEVLQVLPAQA